MIRRAFILSCAEILQTLSSLLIWAAASCSRLAGSALDFSHRMLEKEEAR